jgi:hypothetical protein
MSLCFWNLVYLFCELTSNFVTFKNIFFVFSVRCNNYVEWCWLPVPYRPSTSSIVYNKTPLCFSVDYFSLCLSGLLWITLIFAGIFGAYVALDILACTVGQPGDGWLWELMGTHKNSARTIPLFFVFLDRVNLHLLFIKPA